MDNALNELPLDVVLTHLSERGRVELELAATKALLAHEQQRTSELLSQLARATLDEGGANDGAR